MDFLQQQECFPQSRRKLGAKHAKEPHVLSFGINLNRSYIDTIRAGARHGAQGDHGLLGTCQTLGSGQLHAAVKRQLHPLEFTECISIQWFSLSHSDAQGVFGNPVDPEFIMQVWSGCPASSTHIPDHIALLYFLANLKGDLLMQQMLSS